MYTVKKRKWAVEAVGRDLYAEIRGKGWSPSEQGSGGRIGRSGRMGGLFRQKQVFFFSVSARCSPGLDEPSVRLLFSSFLVDCNSN